MFVGLDEELGMGMEKLDFPHAWTCNADTGICVLLLSSPSIDCLNFSPALRYHGLSAALSSVPGDVPQPGLVLTHPP